jgi:hypothetical protein
MVWLFAPLAVLTACGGGDMAAAGSPTVFSVVPSTITFTAPKGSAVGVCTSGGTADIYVYGGAAPYTINNTVPAYVSISTTQVDRGGFFTVTIIGGCLSPGNIAVVDSLNHVVTLIVNNNPAS